MTRAALAALLLIISSAVHAETISGYAIPIDGDTLRLGGERVRLWAIDAPERGQVCEGIRTEYDCGRVSTQALAAAVNGRGVACTPVERDRYGRVVAVCNAGDLGDLGEIMVRSGQAVAYTRYDRGCRYCTAEAEAQRERAGIWGSRFIKPEDWRRQKR